MPTASEFMTLLDACLPKATSFEEDDVLADERYKKKLSAMVKDALDKGFDIMQRSDGSIIITEMRPVTFLYNWDEKKGKFERAKSGSRIKKRGRNRKYANSNIEGVAEDVFVSEQEQEDVI